RNYRRPIVTRHKRGQQQCILRCKADTDTDSLDVLSHAKVAEDHSWQVEMHFWDDTGYCNHMAKHEEEYVEAIRNMW
ncbi:hypothetical protein DM02DRAFT_479827, partial [Periconia macrospinosa]